MAPRIPPIKYYSSDESAVVWADGREPSAHVLDVLELECVSSIINTAG